MRPQELYKAFSACGIDYYVGVPDSLLQHFCAFLVHTVPAEHHVICANEGNAIGVAIGRYLATGTPAVVYMQNSGLGNVVNPVTSVADAQVSGIPMVFVVGWRGEMLIDGSQMHDEPQHVKMGQVTEDLLTVIGVRYITVDTNTLNIAEAVKDLVVHTRKHSQPVALLVRKNTFEATHQLSAPASTATLSREDAIEALLQALPPTVPIVSTTGMASRELFELRVKRGEGHARDFLTVGAMGHASQIATGVASAYKSTVVCLDGDGSVLMHMGVLALNARQKNLLHVLINNGAHDSVGGQPTAGLHVDFCAIAKACGYADARRVDTAKDLQSVIADWQNFSGAVLLEVHCKTGSRSDLGRPTTTPTANKNSFMEFLHDREND